MQNYLNKLIMGGLFFAFSGLFFADAAHAQYGEPPKPIVEWEKHQNADDRLTAFGDDLMGDGIDPHTGGITFEHTDIVLPGNSALDVSLKRRRSQGYLYHEDVDAEFGDWEYMVPRIKVMSAASQPWTGARCTSSYSSMFPFFSWNQGFVMGSDYSQGLSLDVPGFGKQQILENPSGARWPAGTTHATKKNWRLSCGSASDGGQGFIAKAPNGNTYRFDKFISHKAKALGFVSAGHLQRNIYILAATEVTDIHGNWVRYTYDGSGRLTRIHSNDDRDITLTYSGSSKLVSTVNANGRQWQYSYRQSTFRIPFWEAWNYPLLTSQVLSNVQQPDGKSWTLNMDWMHAQPSPAVECQKNLVTVSMTHPYGTTGTFRIKDLSHRYGLNNISIPGNQHCPDVEQWPGSGGAGSSGGTVYFPTVQTSTMAVISKSLSGSSTPAYWSYTYEQDAGPSGTSSSDKTNWTTVQGPGIHITYFHEWPAESLGGKVLKKEVRASAGSSVLETTDYSYIGDANVGNTFVYSPVSKHAVLTTGTVTSRGGDVFTANNVYNTTSTSPTYSFGRPISVSKHSNVSTTPRVTDTTYEHNKTKWILGLPLSVTTNGRNMATYVYDTLGQKTSQTKYGSAYATFSYDVNGNMEWFKDANLRPTLLSGWKRGTPQDITRADNVSLHQYVDDNGWLTSTVDAMGNTTSYVRDNMGRLTLFTPPAGRAPTTIGYSFGASTVQTITNVQSQSIITYDSMFRPTLVESKDLSTSSSSFINTTYDGSGRAIFTSFPSNSSVSTAGTDTTYDGLGRVVSTTETVSPYASTSTAYLSGHRTAVTDAGGNVTTYTKNGFGEMTQILQPMGVTTDMDINDWGEMLSLRQWGTQNGVTSDQIHTYEYDPQDQYRLCRHHTPESGDTLMAYDPAGYMTSSARGQASGSGCAAPSGNAKVSIGYDLIGRPNATTYADSSTPSISRTYDANGNVLTVDRNGVNWAYGYDTHNTLTSETLSLDGRTYASAYSYNGAGHMMHRILPSGRVLAFENDGLGRQTLIAGGVVNPNAGTTTTSGGSSGTDTGGTDTGGTDDTTCDMSAITIDLGDGYNALTDENLYLNSNITMVGGILVFGGDMNGEDYLTPPPPEPTVTLPPGCEDLGETTPTDESTPPPPPPATPSPYVEIEPAFIADMTNLYSSGMGYHPSGPLSAMTYGNGQVFNQTLNARLQPAHVQSSFGGNIALDMTYSYNNLGKVSNVLNAAITGDNRTYNYDALGRLTSATGPWGAGHTTGLASYTYDALGNMQGKTVGPRVMDMAYGPNNRLISHTDNIGGARSLSYDARGNVTQLGGLFFTYDMSDQPTYISGTASGTYKYDGNLKRVKSTVNGKTIYNVYDAGGTLIHIHKLEEGTNPEERTDYIGKVARVTTTDPGTSAEVVKVTYLHTDQLGSANTGTDENGLVSWREQYTPFGITLTSPLVNNDLAGFTGHIKDSATGLNYMQARYYDPFIGRFLSTDPIGFSPQRPEMFGRYTYVGNDPINFDDPTGMCRGSHCMAMLRRDVKRAATTVRNDPVGSAKAVGSLALDFTPVVGDLKSIGEAIANPTTANIVAAAVGLIPGAGDIAGKSIKAAVKSSDVRKGATVGRRGEPHNAEGNNQPSEVGGREYTGHALDRMQEAGMTPSVVEDTIENGTATAGTGARAGTTKFETDQAMAVTDDASGRVITTDPLEGGGI